MIDVERDSFFFAIILFILRLVRVCRSAVCTEMRAAVDRISKRRRVCVRFRANRERRSV